jgi:hypothetical protein
MKEGGDEEEMKRKKMVEGDDEEEMKKKEMIMKRMMLSRPSAGWINPAEAVARCDPTGATGLSQASATTLQEIADRVLASGSASTSGKASTSEIAAGVEGRLGPFGQPFRPDPGSLQDTTEVEEENLDRCDGQAFSVRATGGKLWQRERESEYFRRQRLLGNNGASGIWALARVF